MNKRITSALLCLVLLFGMLVCAVPVHAAGDARLTVSADKATANPGDIVKFTVSIGAVDNLGVLEFQLNVPDGLTILEESVTLPDGIEEIIDSDGAIVKPWSGSNWFWRYSAQSKGYTGTSELVLVTFSCQVDADSAFENKNVTVTVESFYDNDLDKMAYTVVPVTVAVEPKPVPVTGVTMDSTLSLKTGESKTPSFKITPAEATNTAVSFVSKDPAVASVNKTTGEVTGVKPGTTTITLTTADGGFTAECVVTVACAHAKKAPVAEKASDCKNHGWDAYVRCNDCGQLFAADGTTEIPEIPYRPLTDAHTGGSATCTAQAVCTVCGTSYGTLASHRYTAEEQKTDALKTPGNCREDAIYYYSCVACGKVEKNDAHTFNAGKVADKHAGGSHIEGASSADHKNQIAGSTGTEICDGCGATLTPAQPIAPGAHTPSGTLSHDATHHWKECTVDGCGVVIDGSKTAHSSTGDNVATCQKAAVCDVCGVTYGTVADHSWNTTEWAQDATGHWHTCGTKGCTATTDFSAHTPDHTGGATEDYAVKCTACGYEIAAQLAHTHVYDRKVVSGAYKATKATCTAAATYYKSCKCGAKGTETFVSGTALGHTTGTAWKHDAKNHWHVCTVCSAVITSSKQAHTPDHAGGATEAYGIKCTVCGYEIEAQLSHTHVFDQQTATDAYKATDATCTTAATYYKSCKCGVKGTETFVSGTAPGHTAGTEWLSDPDNHWHECTVNGCGAVIDSSKAPHTPDRAAATETDPVKCSVCGYILAPAAGHTHAHGTEWKSDAENHWNECACGDKTNVTAHKDENADGKCDVCASTVSAPGADDPQDDDKSGFPWWILLLIGGAGAGTAAVATRRKKKKV